MIIPKEIEIINFHLSAENIGSFLYFIHEKRDFQIISYNELINAIKNLHANYNVYDYIHEKYDDCVGYNFIANLIENISMLTAINGGLGKYGLKLKNTTNSDFLDYLDELTYEYESLFAGWEKDYHGNKYK